MEEILHQLRLVVHPIICRVLCIQTVVKALGFLVAICPVRQPTDCNKNPLLPKFEAYVFLQKMLSKLRIPLPKFNIAARL